MPLGDITAGIIDVTVRIIGHILFDLIVDIFIKGPGYIIAQLLPGVAKNDTFKDSIVIFFIGIAFWVVVGLCVYGAYRML